MSLAFQAPNPNPTTPVINDDRQWITAYLTIHSMSENSRRYAYFMWFCIASGFAVVSVLHLSGVHGGVLGAYWARWSIQRRTWRGNHTLRLRQRGKNVYPTCLPPNGQLLALALLPVATFLLCFLGPDYISPIIAPYDIHISGISVRAYDFTRWQPQYTIHKAYWTVAGRAGIIAFALLPLCVLFALKAPPFAVFALSFTTQIHFDKLAWLHRWSGRLIFLVTVFHVIFWSVQLARDHRTSSTVSAYTYAWQYDKFLYGWAAFLLMLLIIALSISPIRKNHYETFYSLHVLFVPLMLIMAALHHPPIWIWCWIALAVWIGERVWRGTWWLYINGVFGRDDSSATPFSQVPHTPVSALSDNKGLRPATYEGPGVYPPPSPFLSNSYSHVTKLMEPKYSPPPGYAHAELLSGATIRLTFISSRYLSWAPGQHFLINIPSVSKILTHPFTSASICDDQSPSDSGRAIVLLVRSKGGWTRDLWDYVMQLVNNGQNHVPGESPPNGTIMPEHGVLMRMYVDGPFGSSVRAKWDAHASVVILVAGSGVSFGLSVLEYVCLCLAGRDGKHLGGKAGGWGKKGFATRRVRFVWLIREFAHIQWCASIVRRCMEMIPSPGLQVDIFVTNAKQSLRASHAPRMSIAVKPPPVDEERDLAPPMPMFAITKAPSVRFSVESGKSWRPVSLASAYASDSDGDGDEVDYGVSDDFDDEMDITVAADDLTLDLTNFDGDNDYTLPGEALLNMRVQRVGRDRRAHSRRFSRAVTDKEPIDEFGSMSRTSMHSTDGLLSQAWRPAHSKRMTIDEGDVGNAHRTSEYYDDSDRPPTPELEASPPRQRIQLPPIRTSGLPRPDSVSQPETPGTATQRDDIISPGGASEASFGGETVTMEDGTKARALHLHQMEMKDISFVAERARPGRPKLDRILKDEVERASGSTVVACCGPTSFAAMVREAIAGQIDPARVRRGDRRGYIDLVSEEFEY